MRTIPVIVHEIIKKAAFWAALFLKPMVGLPATAGTASRGGYVSRDEVTRSPRGFNEIHFDRLHIVQQLFVDHEGETLFLEYLVAFLKLVQSHTHGGPASPTLVQKETDRGNRFLILEIVSEHFARLIG